MPSSLRALAGGGGWPVIDTPDHRLMHVPLSWLVWPVLLALLRWVSGFALVW
jgi:hypothetical protein